MEGGTTELKFEKVSYILLVALTFLLPIFSIPSAFFPLEFEKKLLISGISIVVLIIWLLARIGSGGLHIKLSKLEKVLAVVYVAMALSAILSPVRIVSLGGLGFEVTTLLSLFVFGALLFAVARYFTRLDRALVLFFALSASLAVVFLLQLVSLFVDLSVVGISGTQFTIVGKWTDLGIIFGLGVVLSALGARLLPKIGYLRFGTWALFVISLIGAIVVNYAMVWWVLLILAVLFLTYEFFIERGIGKRLVSLAPIIIVVLVPVVMLMWGRDGAVIERQIETFAPTPLEVRPSWQGTFAIAKETIKQDPIFGVGLNRFSSEWQMHKPGPVNQSLFWGVNFDAGVGYIPTFLITSGILGFLTWAIFLLTLAFFVMRALFMVGREPTRKSLTVMAGFSSIYLWTLTFLYIPSTVNVGLTFLLTGLFIALYNQKPEVKTEETLGETPMRSAAINFVSVLSLIALLLIALTSAYTYVAEARAWDAYSKGSMAVNRDDNVDRGIELLEKATKIREYDLYYRALTEVRLIKISAILSETGVPKETIESLRSQFLDLYGQTLRDAEKTVLEVDPTNYQNWLSLARVYAQVVPLGVKNADVSARTAFDRAILRAPTNPRPYTEASRFEFSAGNIEDGKKLLDYALAIKPKHAPALIIRAQLAIKEGDLDKALTDTRDAVIANPNDVGALFQLGYLEYLARHPEEARLALERAVSLNNYYSDAKYYLGLVYYDLGEKDKAREQFQEVLELNPKSDLVLSILSNLRAGRTPLAGIPPAPEGEGVEE